jgi:hypothetical protein
MRNKETEEQQQGQRQKQLGQRQRQQKKRQRQHLYQVRQLPWRRQHVAVPLADAGHHQRPQHLEGLQELLLQLQRPMARRCLCLAAVGEGGAWLQLHLAGVS